MTSLQREQWGPYLTGAVVTGIWWFALDHTFPADPGDLLNASGTIASVLVGFLATAKAIIMSIATSPTYAHIRSLGYSVQLMNYIRSAIYAGLLFLVIATLGFFIDWNDASRSAAEGLSIEGYRIAWILTGSTGLALYVRVIGLIFKVLQKA